MTGIGIEAVRNGSVGKLLAEEVEVESLGGSHVRIRKVSRAQITLCRESSNDSDGPDSDGLMALMLVAIAVEFQDGETWATVFDADPAPSIFDGAETINNLPVNLQIELVDLVTKTNGLTAEAGKKSREEFPDGDGGSEPSEEGDG